MDLPKGFESRKDKYKLTVAVKLTETDIFKELLKECVEIFTDERIDKKVRKEYENKFNEIIKDLGE